MKEKELVVLLGPKKYLVEVGSRTLHTEYGMIDLSKLKRKKYGDILKTHTGQEFIVVKPNLVDILSKKARRIPQVVLPRDAALILAYTGVPTNSLIVDVGSGSGFLCIFLAYYCSRGRVVTYERDPKFVKVTMKNIALTGLKNIKVKEKDILTGIDEKNVDLITLDMKDAEKVVENAYKSLKPGGWLAVYSPHIEQVKLVVNEMKRHNFGEIRIIENILREWQSKYDYTRPRSLGIMHTGWITLGRKVSLLNKEQKIE